MPDEPIPHPPFEQIDRWGLNALPAFVEEDRGNVVFRAAGGFNYRNSSVTVFQPDLENTEALLPDVLSFSGRNDIEPVLRLLGPAGRFAHELRTQGWVPFRDCLVMTRPGGKDAAGANNLVDWPLAEWLDLQVRHKQLQGEAEHLFRRIFINLPAAARPLASSRTEPAASALLHEEGGWTGLMNMLVDPQRRGQGLGKSFLQEILLQPTAGFWLQVYKENRVAIRLYKASGFSEAYSYGYWRQG